MKPNSVTIRYTNSQWYSEDGTEAPVGRVAVPKSGQKNALPRDNLYPMGSFRFPCSGNTRLSVVFRCPRPSIFVKFTWHANLHYRYL